MNALWSWKRLGDCCLKIGSGATPTGGKESYHEHGPVSLIRSQNVHNNGFSSSGLAFIDEVQAKKLNNVNVEVGDILLNITGDSVARVCLAPPKYLPARVNQHVAIIRPMPDIFDSRYLRYFLTSPYQQNLMLGVAGAGATRNALTKLMIEEFKVPCPSIKVQRSIGDILSVLDDRIYLLQETNTTLEAIAQALFKSWFIDFDPVHAKAEGREPEGMDAETAALFPDSFEDSELGIIPKNWYVTNLGDAYEINPTRKLKKGELAPYLDMANVPTRGHHADKTTMRKMGSGTKFINGDTLLARITPCLENGKTAFVDFLDDNQIGWGSTEFVVLRPKEPIPPYHGYLLARHSAFREFAIQSMSGTSGRQRIQNNVLSRYSIVVPDYRVLELFGSIVSSIQQKISSNSRQAKFLASQRNILLPQLIWGQVSLAKEEMKVYEA